MKSMSEALPLPKRKMIRQFARTVTAQKPFEFALQGVKPEAWPAQRLGRFSRFERRQDVADAFHHVRRQQFTIVVLVETPQSLMLETFDHCWPIIEPDL
jgi:hypothetical protein